MTSFLSYLCIFKTTMITNDCIEKIKDTARIEEVIGDFIHLKKRGTSLVANCPFHGEKTPSFHVSVSKGIYKCFGCGVAGDSVHFVMEHEKYSYPEALKYLANKYNIEVEETIDSHVEREAGTEKESLYVVSAFAADFFQEQLWETTDGQTIGLRYFKERGFTEHILRKFNLGYSPDIWDALCQEASKKQHREEFLEKTGLAIRNEKGSLYDRFRGRVMFPIHNFTGRIIGFGGRTLRTEKNVPKYVNSPESEIYHKSNVLYGLFQAKKAIRSLDNCYLVEGYADVLAMHQADIENVVASSGTSLTLEQIKLIARFTDNVTMLYDGDPAGIKASLRGLDMILEEGLNVKIVSFPDGDDPDSYMHKVGASAFKTYIEGQRKDFILYKTQVLMAETANDPIKKAAVIKDIVESIAKIPDNIKASLFVKECSVLLNMEEKVLLSELHKIRLAKLNKANKTTQIELPPEDLFEDKATTHDTAVGSVDDSARSSVIQEREIVRLILNYGSDFVTVNDTTVQIGPLILTNIADVSFEDELCSKIIDCYITEQDKGSLPDIQFFLHHEDKEIAGFAISITTSSYSLSPNWVKKHKIYVKEESEDKLKMMMNGIYHLKKKKTDQILDGLLQAIAEATEPNVQDELMEQYAKYKDMQRLYTEALGTVIIR